METIGMWMRHRLSSRTWKIKRVRMAYAESVGGKLHYEVIDLVAPWEPKRETHAKHGLPFSHAKQCAQALREFLAGSS